jgi:Glyoxalase superfamily protein
MTRALRDALKTKAIETSHSEALELIAKAFGYENWNIFQPRSKPPNRLQAITARFRPRPAEPQRHH